MVRAPTRLPECRRGAAWPQRCQPGSRFSRSPWSTTSRARRIRASTLSCSARAGSDRRSASARPEAITRTSLAGASSGRSPPGPASSGLRSLGLDLCRTSPGLIWKHRARRATRPPARASSLKRLTAAFEGPYAVEPRRPGDRRRRSTCSRSGPRPARACGAAPHGSRGRRRARSPRRRATSPAAGIAHDGPIGPVMPALATSRSIGPSSCVVRDDPRLDHRLLA